MHTIDSQDTQADQATTTTPHRAQLIAAVAATRDTLVSSITTAITDALAAAMHAPTVDEIPSDLTLGAFAALVHGMPNVAAARATIAARSHVAASGVAELDDEDDEDDEDTQDEDSDCQACGGSGGGVDPQHRCLSCGGSGSADDAQGLAYRRWYQTHDDAESDDDRDGGY